MRRIALVAGLVLAVLLVGMIYTYGGERVIKLRMTFRMGGAVYRGYELEGETMVFKFERVGDAFTQAIETRTFEEKIKGNPRRIVVEVSTNGRVRTYEARLVEEKGNERLYEAFEG